MAGLVKRVGLKGPIAFTIAFIMILGGLLAVAPNMNAYALEEDDNLSNSELVNEGGQGEAEPETIETDPNQNEDSSVSEEVVQSGTDEVVDPLVQLETESGSWAESDAQARADSFAAGVEWPCDVVDISAFSWDSVLALSSSGEVWAAGGNGVGQLGIGNTSSQSSPVLVQGALTGKKLYR